MNKPEYKSFELIHKHLDGGTPIPAVKGTLEHIWPALERRGPQGLFSAQNFLILESGGDSKNDLHKMYISATNQPAIEQSFQGRNIAIEASMKDGKPSGISVNVWQDKKQLKVNKSAIIFVDGREIISGNSKGAYDVPEVETGDTSTTPQFGKFNEGTDQQQYLDNIKAEDDALAEKFQQPQQPKVTLADQIKATDDAKRVVTKAMNIYEYCFELALKLSKKLAKKHGTEFSTDDIRQIAMNFAITAQHQGIYNIKNLPVRSFFDEKLQPKPNEEEIEDDVPF